jgi:hypothetical protein
MPVMNSSLENKSEKNTNKIFMALATTFILLCTFLTLLLHTTTS